MQAMIVPLVPYFIVLISYSILLQSAECDPQVPCFFVFGDSLSDNGNNNDLQTSAKVNYSPYGIDYPGQTPTGRFNNGRTIVDVISTHLRFKESSPPFASIDTVMDEKIILNGVNYASGSAGIRNETGQHMGVRIPLDEQLANHGKVVERISNMIGNENSTSYMKKCLYMINMGSNDYLNNYFLPEEYETSELYSPVEYAQVLTRQYYEQIQRLYGMGARKVALFSLGQLGLIPQSISECKSRGILVCSTQRTLASTLFNVQLCKLVDLLNSKLPDANFTSIRTDFTSPTSTAGLLHLFEPCCEVRSDGLCKEGNTACKDRDLYAFFDNYHPTQALSSRIGDRAYKMLTPLDVYPIDIRTLVHI